MKWIYLQHNCRVWNRRNLSEIFASTTHARSVAGAETHTLLWAGAQGATHEEK